MISVRQERALDGSDRPIRVILEGAEPVEMISKELLDMVRDGQTTYLSLDGNVLTIDADNQRVVYVVDMTSLTWDRCYRMTWPD